MVHRRKLFVGAAAAVLAPLAPPAWADTGFPSRRWVKIVFINTGERFNNLYFSDGAYIVPAVKECRPRRQDLHLWRRGNVPRPRLRTLRFRPLAQLGRVSRSGEPAMSRTRPRPRTGR